MTFLRRCASLKYHMLSYHKLNLLQISKSAQLTMLWKDVRARFMKKLVSREKRWTGSMNCRKRKPAPNVCSFRSLSR